MNERKSRLKADPTDWLLQDDNPSVRYLTLKDLLGKKEQDDEVSEARARIMEVGPGSWGAPEDFYGRTKYRGTVWNLIVLAELRADPEDAKVNAACEFVMKWSQDRSSGGFSHRGTGQRGGQRSGVICCLTGNMAFSLSRLGYARDPRVIKALDWITTYMRYEIVSEAPQEWPYTSFHCWRDHTCRSGAVKTLKALAEVPKKERTKAIQAKIEEGAEYLLAQHIFKKPPGLRSVARKEWLKFGFPLMWNTDILEILDILTRLGYRDERMNEAMEVVLSKQGEDAAGEPFQRAFRHDHRAQRRREQMGHVECHEDAGRTIQVKALPRLRRPGR